jgi:uncharacterized protein (DUF4213/DUF364 family)
MISEELKKYLQSAGSERQVVDVRIGLGYSAAMLDDGNVGVAYTVRENIAAGCTVFTGQRPLAGSKADVLLDFLTSDESVEVTVGLAVANALANREAPGQLVGDTLDHLLLQADDKVGMVGYFGPLVGPLRERVRELLIFERKLDRSDALLPAEQAGRLLPGCDVALITSTALLNGTLDELLEAASGCREVVLVGASTPLVPAIFARHGVTLLSGITVTDGPAILQIVSEGGGMGSFGKRIRKLSVRP